MAEVKKKPVSIEIDPRLWQQAKINAAILGMSLMDYVSEAIREKIEKGGK